MLTPDYLENVPAALMRLWQQVEDDILRDVARRIGKMGEVTATADWQLWRREQVRLVNREVLKILAKYSGRSEAELRRIFQEAAAKALEDDDRLYTSAGLDPPAPNEDPALLNLLNAGYEQTAGSWQNLTATTAQTVSGQFEAALDRAWLQVASGAFDYKTAVRKAVRGLAANMAGVTYPTGHRDTLEVAVRRAVLTGVNQTAGKLQIARMEEMDWQFVETSAHAGARPEHAKWQGRQFHRGGAVTYGGRHYPDFVQATGYGTGAGLCGWNCRHSFFAIDPDLSEPAYTEAELAALDAKDIEYRGKLYTRYELSQKQRALERKVRAAKRRCLAEDAAGLDTAQSAVKLRQARQNLAQFIRDTGGREDSARTFVSGFGRSEASRATAQARPFAAFRRENAATTDAQRLPGREKAVIPDAKLTGYALNMDHPKGRDKAVAFRDALGYTVDNAADLKTALLDGLQRWKATARAPTKYGQPFEVKMLLTGPNGKTATVKTGWQIDAGSDTPRLTSAYVYKEKGE